MSSIDNAPWQVIFAAGASIVMGVTCAVSARMQTVFAGDYLALEARSDQYRSFPGLESASLTQIHEWLQLAATVFAIVATVYVLLGILLWQGILRPGVRLTLLITSVISLCGGLSDVLAGFAGSNAIVEWASLVNAIVNAIVVVSAASLWSASARPWFSQT